MKLKHTLFIFFLASKSFAQVGINSTGAAPDPKAMLDINSTTKGFLWPRMTHAQRTAISTAPGVTPEGLTVFDTDTKNLWIFKNAAWEPYLPSPWQSYGIDIFYANDSNNPYGKVGIGTAGPTAKLDVINYANSGLTSKFRTYNDVNSETTILSENYGLGQAGSFVNIKVNNPSNALYAETKGLGNASAFLVNNNSNNNPAVSGESNGTGQAIYGKMTGTGKAAVFEINNLSNNNTALSAIITAGTGKAAYFQGPNALETNGAIKFGGSGVGTIAAGNVLTAIDATGNATWQNAATTHTHYSQSWTGSALKGLEITNFASADFNVAISGNANTALRSKGIVGSSTSTTGIGVYGINSSGGGSFFSPADNSGVSGVAGNGIGVFGAGYSGRGIWGISNSAEGVYGNSVTGNSIYGAKTLGQTAGSAGVFEVLNVANTSSALVARSENTALEIDGAIKVINTSINKPIFTHIAAIGNISGGSSHITSITYPNPSSTDFLMVTPNYTAGPVYNAHPIGVYWNGSKWTIFNQDLAAMPVGTAFNVMVIRQ